MISIGQPVLAAPQQGTAQTGSFHLTEAQISKLKTTPESVKDILLANPGVDPVTVAAAIANALGSDLNTLAPKIAAAMVQYVITPGVNPTTEQQAADVVSVFVSMVKGSAQEKIAAINAIGTEVAAVVKTVNGTNGADLAKNIVGVTLTDLKFSPEGADKPTLDAFADPFKTGNPNIDNELAKIVTQVSNGQPYNALPTSPSILNSRNDNPAVGHITKHESSTQNAQPTPTPI